MFPSMRNTRGFTLIEIMVVVVILGILATLIVPQLMSRPDEAKRVKAKQDIQAIETALNLYNLDNGVYPTTDQGLRALINAPTTAPTANHWKTGGYLKSLPIDPWNRPYQYLNPGIHNPNGVDIFTLGADSQAGGVEKNQDIGNWSDERA